MFILSQKKAGVVVLRAKMNFKVKLKNASVIQISPSRRYPNSQLTDLIIDRVQTLKYVAISLPNSLLSKTNQ